jgi:hypothetical protein
LQGNLFIFGVGMAVALFLLGNFVKGLRATAYSLVDEVRAKLWGAYDALSASADPAVQDLLDRHLIPLLRLSRWQWLNPDEHQGWKNLAPTTTQMATTESGMLLLLRYLVPIEDILNELTRCSIRAWCIGLLVRASRNVFVLMFFGVLVGILGKLAPSSLVLDALVSMLCAAAIAALLMELANAFTYVLQELREEYAEILDDSDLTEQTDEAEA